MVPCLFVRFGETAGVGCMHHAQALSLVCVDKVGKDLGGSGNRDAALVSKLVEPALHA